MVKDASVVHPRRADWSQVLSSVLNIGVLTWRPPEQACYPYRHLRRAI